MWNSLKTGFIINLALTSVSYVKELLYDINFVAYAVYESVSTIGMVAYMNTIEKPDIKQQNKESNLTINFISSSALKIVGITTIKCITHSALINGGFVNNSELVSDSYILPVINFVVRSFAFEMIFDCAHYVVHRSFHEFPVLYQNVHKYHHEYSNPTAWTAFHIHPVDLMLSYSIPLLVATIFIFPTKNELLMITTYLTHQEIGGHLGKRMYPTSCFAQFIWLPRIFDIELYTEDHDLHHKQINCNFGKRFALCDKMFNTYKSGTESGTECN